MDIRAREVKGRGDLTKHAELVERTFQGSGATEIFISFETPDKATIFGFARLRLSLCSGGFDDGRSHVRSSGRKRRGAEEGVSTVVFPELVGVALIRELHVYGKLNPTEHQRGNQQHVGLGTRLMKHAEKMAAQAGASKVAVISGVGVRNFYRKLGYELDPGRGEFMIKTLPLVFKLRHGFIPALLRIAQKQSRRGLLFFTVAVALAFAAALVSR